MANLEYFLHNETNLLWLLQIAVAHAQFELIHPYLVPAIWFMMSSMSPIGDEPGCLVNSYARTSVSVALLPPSAEAASASVAAEHH